MITIRHRDERGSSNIGWLNSQHSFSFGHYHDPKYTGYGALRVINEDKVIGGAGFAEHPHNDMEIVSYVLEGQLEHKDSMGTGSVINPSDIQRMSAGTGVTHSEYNASQTDLVHFLQIWFLPERNGIAPSYAQTSLDSKHKENTLKLAMSRDGRDGSLTINQDIDFYVASCDRDANIAHRPKNNRIQWVQIAKGNIDVNGHTLHAGDGAAIEDEKELIFTNANMAELLLFDMADIR